jgi:hypothetical protein
MQVVVLVLTQQDLVKPRWAVAEAALLLWLLPVAAVAAAPVPPVNQKIELVQLLQIPTKVTTVVMRKAQHQMVFLLVAEVVLALLAEMLFLELPVTAAQAMMQAPPLLILANQASLVEVAAAVVQVATPAALAVMEVAAMVLLLLQMELMEPLTQEAVVADQLQQPQAM